MMKAVIITGHSGGIGCALVDEFKKTGYFTIGIGRQKTESVDVNIVCDLEDLVHDEKIESVLSDEVRDALRGKRLKLLINNAAVQILDDINTVKLNDFKRTLDVNLIAPFLLSKLLYSLLKEYKGSIINIGSIHAKQTKPKFISYATSKAALKGLTQAMAVDFGKYVRVNIIQPAAISTEMLVDGFRDNPEGLKKLELYHPSGNIGTPEEVARLAVYLAGDSSLFLNGSTIDIDGAIGARLHDPD